MERGKGLFPGSAAARAGSGGGRSRRTEAGRETEHEQLRTKGKRGSGFKLSRWRARRTKGILKDLPPQTSSSVSCTVTKVHFRRVPNKSFCQNEGRKTRRECPSCTGMSNGDGQRPGIRARGYLTCICSTHCHFYRYRADALLKQQYYLNNFHIPPVLHEVTC